MKNHLAHIVPVVAIVVVVLGFFHSLEMDTPEPERIPAPVWEASPVDAHGETWNGLTPIIIATNRPAPTFTPSPKPTSTPAPTIVWCTEKGLKDGDICTKTYSIVTPVPPPPCRKAVGGQECVFEAAPTPEMEVFK